MTDVILVDEQDRQIGTEEKMKAHENGGKLHRAFSVFVFNSQGKLLIQRRALAKYHCAGIWANTCCSHPFPGESLGDAAHRRLIEEMGFDCDLRETFSFIYKADFENGLTEWEFDHVFVGKFDEEVKPDPEEVGEFEWVEPEQLKKDIEENPKKYAEWFKISVGRVLGK
jgi:isopentenyl-diphosphate Delta-isomerase